MPYWRSFKILMYPHQFTEVLKLMELLETISTSRAMRHVKLNSHSHLRNRLEIAKLAKSFTNNKIPESFKSNVFLKSHFLLP